MNMTELSLAELARLCHQAEDKNDDVTVQAIDTELQRRREKDPQINHMAVFRNSYMELWRTEFKPKAGSCD